MPMRPKTHRQLMIERFPQMRPRDARTLTSSERGYDARWQKARASFLRRHPLCLYCSRAARHTLAALIDHNPPHRGDMIAFWDESTWVPSCSPCHNHVTATFDGGGGKPLKPREGIYVRVREGELPA